MKTTIDIDQSAAGEAAAVLGTTTLQETVNAALREVAGTAKREELADLVSRGELMMPTPTELERLHDPGIEVGALDGLDHAG